MTTPDAKFYASLAACAVCGAVALRTNGDTGLGWLVIILLLLW